MADQDLEALLAMSGLTSGEHDDVRRAWANPGSVVQETGEAPVEASMLPRWDRISAELADLTPAALTMFVDAARESLGGVSVRRWLVGGGDVQRMVDLAVGVVRW
ncbi:hypothetical protein [Demequina maris]|uniref:hypothetical protein n=1 Tax=Demequina maris TaxID=1638982 RepID=UPI0007802FD2|nr:hypothetical protein [Demequina maris]